MSSPTSQKPGDPGRGEALRSLAAVAAERPLELPEVLGVLRDTASALAELHATGAVHGAVCAANIVLDRRGVARLCHDAVAPPSPSPEQGRGEPPGVGSDIYGLGAAVRDLLGDPSHLPEPVLRLLATMMAEEPAERYRSMGEVLSALEACELLAGCRACRPGRQADALGRRRQMLPLAIVLLGLLMLALALLVVFGRTPPAEDRRPTGLEKQLRRAHIRRAGDAPGERPASRLP